MKYLTLEQLLEMHVLVIEATGGATGLRDLGRLEATIATQSQSVFGDELYPTVYNKAAALIRGVIGDHAFVDGNKRTGTLAGLTFLKINEVTFNFKDRELEDFAVRVATERLSVEVIAEWIESHS